MSDSGLVASYEAIQLLSVNAVKGGVKYLLSEVTSGYGIKCFADN